MASSIVQRSREEFISINLYHDLRYKFGIINGWKMLKAVTRLRQSLHLGDFVFTLQVVGFGKHEGDADTSAPSNVHSPSCSEIPHLTFLDASSLIDVTCIKDIKMYTSALNVLPYHKILK